MSAASTSRSVADRLVGAAAGVLGRQLPVRLRAWDGSEAGPAAGPVLVLHGRRALRRLLWKPGALGLAEAYIAGEIDIEGDLAEVLSALWRAGDDIGARPRPAIQWRQLLRTTARLGFTGRRPPAPSAPSLAGQRHCRNPAELAQHDVRPRFFEVLLGPSMAHSCGYFVDGPAGGLADAQLAGLDLICRRLGLSAGDRHLDVGCGWGALICYAAEHYGTYSTGVTASEQQYEYVSKRVADAGLADRVQVRLADYRELGVADDEQFDAVSAIEIGEQVSDAEYPVFAGILRRVLSPGGRALVQQVSRGRQPPVGGAFVATYLGRDLQVRPLVSTVSQLAAAGLEVRDVHALREHYEWTFQAWAAALERSWNGAVDLIGEAGARVWRLYLVGGAQAFAENRVRVDQIMTVRPQPSGDSQCKPLRAF